VLGISWKRVPLLRRLVREKVSFDQADPISLFYASPLVSAGIRTEPDFGHGASRRIDIDEH
jgi:hypothetical protein